MKPLSASQIRSRLGRLPLLLLGMAALLFGIWGGLVRLPIALPIPAENANWITYHGPLMVCGFLGTVIGLERAVALRHWWTYLPPLLTGTGGIMLILGALGQPPVILVTIGSALFAVVAWRVVQMQPVLFTTVMAFGALAWGVGNGLWAAGWPFNRVVPWWIAFLALTIVGERLDLSRFQRPSRWSPPLLYGALALFVVGVVMTVATQVMGERIVGAGLLALALWLFRFDIARRTVRQQGLTRFMAVCLLTGYFWLAVAGALVLASAPLESGLKYDGALHAFFLGFVFSMIFGHAPVIFPAVLNLQPSFRPVFYLHLAVLHAALLLRVGSDLGQWPVARQWGGALNAIAVALFLVTTVVSFLFPAKPPPPGRGNSRGQP